MCEILRAIESHIWNFLPLITETYRNKTTLVVYHLYSEIHIVLSDKTIQIHKLNIEIDLLDPKLFEKIETAFMTHVPWLKTK